MSALRGSRSAADVSTAIAPSQSSASSAFLPAANSGSSLAQSASGMATVMVLIGQSSDAVLVSVEAAVSLGRDAAVSGSGTGRNTYAVAPATSAPSSEATTIERIILVGLLSPTNSAYRPPSSAGWPSRFIVAFTASISLSLQVSLGLTHFRPLALGIFREIDEISKIV